MLSKYRVFGLDAIRALAILIVLACHLVVETYGYGRPGIRAFIVWSAIIGVELFFVLSGFLIGRILCRLIQKQENFTTSDFFPFWRRRWWRTLPNYLLFLVVFAVIDGRNGADTSNWWRFVLFIQNFTPPRQDAWYGVAWSLAIEEWSYLLLPVFCALGIAVQRRIKGSGNSAAVAQSGVLTAIITLLAVPTLCRLTLGSGIDWWSQIHCDVIFRLDAIVLGVGLAWVSTFRPKIFPRLQRPNMALAGALCTLSASLLAVSGNIHAPTYLSTTPPGFFMNVLAFPLMDIGIVPIVAWAATVRPKRLPAWFDLAISRIALYSYSLYLSHLAVFSLLRSPLQRLFGEASLRSHLMLMLADAIAAFVVAVLTHHIFEGPMTRLRDRKKQIIT